MAKGGVVGQGVRRPPAARVAGRRRWRSPRLVLPRWYERWRRVALFGVIVALAMFGGWWVYGSPLLSIRDVTVEGNVALSPDVVRSVAGLEGESIVWPDFAGARERLLSLALVKDVEISRDWPAGATITIIERAPWALWDVGGRRFVVDDEGVVLDLPAPANALIIVQIDAVAPLAPGDRVEPGAMAVARRLVPTAQRTLGRRVVALEFSQASGLTVVLDGGPDQPRLRATFGDAQGYEFKVAALYAVLRQAQEEGRTLRSVDLRFGDRVAIQ